MKTIQILDLDNKVLFEYNKENNSLKDTVEYAVSSGISLHRAYLRGANLGEADLGRANLGEADLGGAYLHRADLGGANLGEADLGRANLYGANLRGAYLGGANLYEADLGGANLSEAYLGRAYLHRANLYEADLRGANLHRANLDGADLDISSLWFAQTRILPEGDIIGYKKCKNNVIVKLLIPAKAKRSNAFGRKCRAEYVRVLEIFGDEKAISVHDSDFVYQVGKTVKPKEPFSEEWVNECASGIHFFITKKEAEDY